MTKQEINNSTSASTQRQVAVRIAETSSDAERRAFTSWANQLLVIKASDAKPLLKARQAIAVTRQHKVVWPSIRMISSEMKKRAWDDRGTAGRLGLAGAAAGLALFGGQGAGIAAFGTAIGVPLWVVLGSGAAFAGVLVEELSSKSSNPTTTYTVIDAKKVDK